MFADQFTPEVILSFLTIVFMAGSFYSVQKKLETKMKESDKDLQFVIREQAVQNEKINKLDEKMNKMDKLDDKMTKMEIQNFEIIKILTKRYYGNDEKTA